MSHPIRRLRPVLAGSLGLACCLCAHAQEEKKLEPVVVSASRIQQSAFDASASVSSIEIEPFSATAPLVNLSELTGSVPGLQVRERQNYAQDLQLSIRGFGTRSTFGVRGVRLLVDGIPATMPDGQGQAATANLGSIRRIEVLRGPPAQLYGNAAGGVVQIFTADPPLSSAARSGTADDAMKSATGSASTGYGSDNQRQAGATLVLPGHSLGGLIDVAHYRTDGYRDHSAAERTQVNGKIKWQSSTTMLTGILNVFEQPLSQDPLGLTRAQFTAAPRQAVSAAYTFDTRKTIDQKQAGLVLEHKPDERNTYTARLYGGKRTVWQALGFSGAARASSGGIVDLDNDYLGFGVSWTHSMTVNGLPLRTTLGYEADRLDQLRRGYENTGGVAGSLRRDELDQVRNSDVFAQTEWTFLPAWKGSLGLRFSQVRFAIDDRYVTVASPDDSGKRRYENLSPVLGLTWFASENINVYANIGRGFETPTLTEIAYRPQANGPNLELEASRSLQGEIGMKWRSGRQSLDFALFGSRSRDEIVPQSNDGGRTIYQNVDKVDRSGMEVSWSLNEKRFSAQAAYTLLAARFGESFMAGAGRLVAAGNRLPGVPVHSLFSQIEYRPAPGLAAALEMRSDSKVYVDDINSDAAPGYTAFNLRAGKEFRSGKAKWYLYGRIDNLFDRDYAGSVIVNEGNGRYFEPAAGRRFFVGLRAAL